MAKVVTTLAVEDGMFYEDINCFKTENFVGIWSHTHEDFMIIRKEDEEFHPYVLKRCWNLKELDEVVYNVCEEHILEVFESGAYEFVLKTEE